MNQDEEFGRYCRAWCLEPEGDPIVTPRAHLFPVRRHGRPAMLKIATEPEERFGSLLMAYWNGDGAAPVLAHDDRALLLERAMGPRSLVTMARSGAAGDDEASRIICAVADRLHARRPHQPPELVPLTRWFEALLRAGPARGGILAHGAETAHKLLADQRDITVLHADLHHANILDFGERGWLAIDPKRVTGERAFDYANIFRDPDAMEDGGTPVATVAGRFERQIRVVSEAARLEPTRLTQWVFAFAALSAIWCFEDNQSATLDLSVMAIAEQELARR